LPSTENVLRHVPRLSRSWQLPVIKCGLHVEKSTTKDSTFKPINAIKEPRSQTPEIRDLNLEVALHSMIMTLKPGPFSNSLYKRPLTSMGELRAWASVCI
ncbi:hypothetical protein CR513_38849, partial [Mucuna pruriens]